MKHANAGYVARTRPSSAWLTTILAAFTIVSSLLTIAANDAAASTAQDTRRCQLDEVWSTS